MRRRQEQRRLRQLRRRIRELVEHRLHAARRLGSSTGRNPDRVDRSKVRGPTAAAIATTRSHSRSRWELPEPHMSRRPGRKLRPRPVPDRDYVGAPAANSIDQPTAANLEVTVGFIACDRSTETLDDDPVMFRLGEFNTPSQTQALDCGASGAAGWRAKIVSGCAALLDQRAERCLSQCRIRTRARRTASMPKTERSHVKNAYTRALHPGRLRQNQNNWDQEQQHGAASLGSALGATVRPRPQGLPSSGKKTYPDSTIHQRLRHGRRWLGCTGDDSAGQTVARNKLWGHVTTYVTRPILMPAQAR